MIGQVLLFYCVTIWGGTLRHMETNAYELFTQNVTLRKSYLQNDMVHRWSNITDSVNSINSDWEELRGTLGGTDNMLADRDAMDSFLMQISNKIIYILRKNSVTGAFVVLDQPMTESDTVVSRPGLYIRDTDPESAAKDNSDLAIKRGSTLIYRQLGITTDIMWTPRFSFNEEAPEFSNYFRLPMEAAKEHPELELSDLGYWCPPASSSGAASSLTYSLPLIDANGKVYGVIGVEISTDYLKKMLPSGELNDSKRAAYCLAHTTVGHDELTAAVVSGSFLNRYILTGSVIKPLPDSKTDKLCLPLDSVGKAYVDIQPLQLYNTDTPFSREQWVLLGVIDTHDLLAFPNQINSLALLSAMLSVLAGLVFGSITITLLTNPIKKLIGILHTSDPNRPVSLSKIYVTEIDELSAAIEDLSLRVSESSSTLSRVIEMSDLVVAAFEVDKLTGRVLCTSQLFSILCIGGGSDAGHASLTRQEFKSLMESAKLAVDEVLEKGWIVHTHTEAQSSRWIKITLVDEPNRILGVLVDITEDTLSKRHIEYERDYDLLTNLLNRRAFMVAMRRLFDEPDVLGTAALLLLDLDNLKYINDNYGHDCGDGYLRAAANAMNTLPLQSMLVSRMAGDEFFIFIYGCLSKEQIRGYLATLKQTISESYFILPGGDSIRIRCSAGITWYPDDTEALEDLTRYADFAMYSAKNTKKGDFCEFVRADYDKNSYLLHSREELNKLIEHSLLDFHFQPIASAATGEIFAYEALMRSRLETLRTPLEVLALARTQSKLYEIERLTWFSAMEAATADAVFLKTSCRIFINSVSNHMLSDDDIEELRSSYRSHLTRIVLEVTEEEKFNESITRQKQDLLHSWGASVALDDFGTGYNGEVVLLQLVPDFVKIDMSIVRGIDSDPSRRELFRNLVSYSHERGIMVVAEGVETSAEMVTLIGLGTDYLQGYYLGRPMAQMQGMPENIAAEIRAAAESAGE